MNSREKDEVIGILEALAVAVQNRRTWYEVNLHNQQRKPPIDSVTATLAAVAARQGFEIDAHGE